MTFSEEIEAALDAFWHAAYEQGRDQRDHDDEEGTAQKAEDNLRKAIAGLSASSVSVKLTEGMIEAALEDWCKPALNKDAYRDDVTAMLVAAMSAIEPAGVGVETPPPSTHVWGNLDWIEVAKLAGRNGIRYPSNASLKKFLQGLSGGDEDTSACPVCGNEERGQGGYLSCECPAPPQPRASVPATLKGDEQ